MIAIMSIKDEHDKGTLWATANNPKELKAQINYFLKNITDFDNFYIGDDNGNVFRFLDIYKNILNA